MLISEYCSLLNWSIAGSVLLCLLFQGSTLLAESITAHKYSQYRRYRIKKKKNQKDSTSKYKYNFQVPENCSPFSWTLESVPDTVSVNDTRIIRSRLSLHPYYQNNNILKTEFLSTIPELSFQDCVSFHNTRKIRSRRSSYPQYQNNPFQTQFPSIIPEYSVPDTVSVNDPRNIPFQAQFPSMIPEYSVPDTVSVNDSRIIRSRHSFVNDTRIIRSRQHCRQKSTGLIGSWSEATVEMIFLMLK